MRVLQKYPPMRACKLRITPAYAGITLNHNLYFCFHRDHPRVCGYYRWHAKDISSTPGSPPRMRVLPSGTWMRGRFSRITPAYAGITFRKLKMIQAYQDHPRVCGYYATANDEHRPGLGSPPRMRVLQ